MSTIGDLTEIAQRLEKGQTTEQACAEAARDLPNIVSMLVRVAVLPDCSDWNDLARRMGVCPDEVDRIIAEIVLRSGSWLALESFLRSGEWLSRMPFQYWRSPDPIVRAALLAGADSRGFCDIITAGKRLRVSYRRLARLARSGAVPSFRYGPWWLIRSDHLALARALSRWNLVHLSPSEARHYLSLAPSQQLQVALAHGCSYAGVTRRAVDTLKRAARDRSLVRSLLAPSPGP